MFGSVVPVVVKKTANFARDSGEEAKWQSENACRQQEYSTNARVAHQRADECSPKLTSTELTSFLQGVGKPNTSKIGQPSCKQYSSEDLGSLCLTDIKGDKGATEVPIKGARGSRGGNGSKEL